MSGAAEPTSAGGRWEGNKVRQRTDFERRSISFLYGEHGGEEVEEIRRWSVKCQLFEVHAAYVFFCLEKIRSLGGCTQQRGR